MVESGEVICRLKPMEDLFELFHELREWGRGEGEEKGEEG
jgi:hypothetical protein